MTRDAYPRLVLTGGGDDAVLTPIALASERNEAWLRDFLLANPAALPAADLDPAYADPVAICSELRTPAGPIDAVFVNRHGALTLVECKLFRNPQARQEVVAQILDYAKELARWGYADFQAAVSARLARPGRNVPFETVAAVHPGLEESAFVDAIAYNLSRGRFLLLIAGDGIRAETEALAEYVQDHGALRFTLGLVEMRGFALPDGRLLVQPRVLARTREVERAVYRVVGDREGSEPPTETIADEEPASSNPGRDAYIASEKAFWAEFTRRLVLDDPSQPMLSYRPWGHARAPIGHADAGIVAYRARKDQEIGVFIRFRGVAGRRLWEVLRDDAGEIEIELDEAMSGTALHWEDWAEKLGFATVKLSRPETWTPETEANERHLAWLTKATNAMVNIFRPRLRALSEADR